MLKSSKFNFILPEKTKKGNYLLFNTLSKAIIFIDNELKDILNDISKISTLDQKSKKILIDNKILIEDTLQEEKIFNVIHNKVKYDSSTTSFLFLPTYRCNCQCYYCYEGAGEIFKQIMSKETLYSKVIPFIKSITKENKSERVILGLYGGEPLLFPELDIEIANQIKQWASDENLQFYCTLTSNATLMNKEIIENLILPYVNSVHFTLDGPKEIHDTIRMKKSGEGTFDEIIQAVNLLKNHPRIHLTFRIHYGHKDNFQEDLHNLSNLLDYLESLDIKDHTNSHIYFVQIEPSDACLSSTYDNNYLERKFSGMEIMVKILQLAKDKGWGNKMNIDSGAEHSLIQYNTIPCEYLQEGKYVIDPSANIYKCPTSAGHEKFKVGTITTNGKYIFNSTYYSIMTKNPTLIDPCKDCYFLPICSGPCPITAYDATGSYKEGWCGQTKNLLTQSLITHFKFVFSDRY